MSPSPTNDTETAAPVAATQQAFADATSAMYRAFDGLQPRGDMSRCRHCVTDADVARLAGPVSGLDPEVVTRFVMSGSARLHTAQRLAWCSKTY